MAAAAAAGSVSAPTGVPSTQAFTSTRSWQSALTGAGTWHPRREGGKAAPSGRMSVSSRLRSWRTWSAMPGRSTFTAAAAPS